MSPLRHYLAACAFIRGSGGGTAETSYYSPVEAIFNSVGDLLRPKVRIVVQQRNLGAGSPDLGFYTQDQFSKQLDTLKPGVVPSRGVGEVKPPAHELDAVIQSEQVERYRHKYGQVLVTNLRAFALIGESADGRAMEIDRFELAQSEREFWKMCENPARLSVELEAKAQGFFKRVMLFAAPIGGPKELAELLASYAVEARASVERAPKALLDELDESLAELMETSFSGDKGRRFLNGTIVQTLFYGVFASWVLWHNENPEREDTFEPAWGTRYRQLPVINALFHYFTQPQVLDALDVQRWLDLAVGALNRVKRKRFFARFEVDAHAIQYFYEPFLKHYDPKLRKDLGVWYTPPELVRYMVARVDRMLEEDLGYDDGLADPRVKILDPCCGTGAFLVEVMRVIRRRMEKRWAGATVGDRLKKALLERVYGFELLTAPYVVAHLQVELALKAAGGAFGPGERPQIILTNALTPSHRAQHVLPMGLREEHERGNLAKDDKGIVVVLGNPPYDGVGGVVPKEEEHLLSAYRDVKGAGVLPREGRLNDLYVRFFAMATKRVSHHPQGGIVCFVSNSSWLDGLSYPAMRENLLETFKGGVWIDNLNGDSRDTGKTTPDGAPDPSVFSSSGSREGIQVGTAVATLLIKGDGEGAVQYRDFWGTSKLAQLAAAAGEDQALGDLASLGIAEKIEPYRPLHPIAELGLPFVEMEHSEGYLEWTPFNLLFPTSYPGVKTSRDEALVSVDRETLEKRMALYFDPNLSSSEVGAHLPVLMKVGGRFDGPQIRKELLRRGFRAEGIRRHAYRPFDLRWLYWEGETKLLDEKRQEYMAHVHPSNIWIAAAHAHRGRFDPPAVSTAVASLHINERTALMTPIKLYVQDLEGERWEINLSSEGKAFAAELGLAPEDVFFHALAVLHAPQYRRENGTALKQAWPRLPMPESYTVAFGSAELGRRLAALLDVEQDEPPRADWEALVDQVAVPTSLSRQSLQVANGHYRVTWPWGTLRGGKVWPGEAFVSPCSPSVALLRLGDEVLNVHLNEDTVWAGVPKRVWEYEQGGYQVLKKWLSYRSEAVLGRSLTMDEVDEFTGIARRIARILLLDEALDANYAACCGRDFDPRLLSIVVPEPELV